MVRVRALVCNPVQLEQCQELEFLADTGALLSLVPRSILRQLGITPLETRQFRSFDSRVVERQVGAAIFRYGGVSAPSAVIFGGEEDIPLLGVVALETLGYQVDPVSGELKRIELLML